MEINSYLPRDLFPIKNFYRLEESFHYDLTIDIFYLQEHTGQIVIRRHDDLNCWQEELFLLLENERIPIPFSNYNYVIFSVQTTTKLEKFDLTQKQKIPKIIVQMSQYHTLRDGIDRNQHCVLLEKNPEYEYKFFTHAKARLFIKTHFSAEVLLAYDTIVPGAFKADIFRYCFLFICGGCYVDFKMIARRPLRQIIKSEDDLLVCVDYDRGNTMEKRGVISYLNSLILVEKNNPKILKAIQFSVGNILSRQAEILRDIDLRGAVGILNVTGPHIFYRAVDRLTDEQIRFKHIIVNNDENIYKNFQIVDFEGQLIFTKTNKTYSYSGHYGELWTKKELFYYNRRTIGRYTFYVYPNRYGDNFDFEFKPVSLSPPAAKLLILRNINSGWILDLRISIINEDSCQEQIVFVGKNNKQVKELILY